MQVYSEIVENPFADHEADATLALTGEVNPHFIRLRDWILDVAKANKELICSNAMSENNLLLAQVGFHRQTANWTLASTSSHICAYMVDVHSVDSWCL